MEKIKLGVIGMSEGNGHPYSWSAIFNGFDNKYMKDCPFPVIPNYLSTQEFPKDFLTQDAQVTHIYTQDKKNSHHIAKASKIPNIIDSPQEMIGKIDALLLARDDAENHFQFAQPFLEVGIPIFIDKPLAHSLKAANNLFELQEYESQIYTCSALRYAKEFVLSEEQKKYLGDIVSIQAYTPKSWEKYAIHVIEPVLRLLNFPSLSNFRNNKVKNYHRLSFVADNKTLVTINSLDKAKFPLCIEIIGTENSEKLIFADSFYAFRASLKEFIEQIRSKENHIPRTQTLQVIQVIEEGLKNYEK